jgi:hypothetical protein
MSLAPRHKFLLWAAAITMLAHVLVAATAKASFALTIFGDALSCIFVLLANLACVENSRRSNGVLSLFWKLMSTGLFFLLLSESYWLYFDSLRRFSSPSPVLGDSLFLLAHVFFLFALALRPHSSSAGRNLGLRWLDFGLLAMWWFTLYGYFCLPWQTVVQDFSKYNPGYYILAFVLHGVILTALLVLRARVQGAWRQFYNQLFVGFFLITAGNLLLSMAIDKGFYYAGSFFDSAFFVGICWLLYAATLAPGLEPQGDAHEGRELKQGIWTARVAMIAVVSLPAMAIAGYFLSSAAWPIAVFRLRLAFGAMFCLSAMLLWKLSLLSRQLVNLVTLTEASITNLHAVQEQVAQTQKLTALGRLASGATHEISNPLTAILGYSELLADIPQLSAEDRQSAQAIRRQVHTAQAAVDSLRSTLRRTPPQHPIVAGRPGDEPVNGR